MRNTFSSYLSRGGLALGLVSLSFLFASQGLFLWGALWLTYWGEQSDESGDDLIHTISGQAYYLLRYSYFQISGCIAMLLYRLLFIIHRRCASYNYHYSMLMSVLCQKLSYFDITPIGKILTKFSQDLFVIDDDMTVNVLVSGDLIAIIIASIVIIAISTYGYMLIIMMPLFGYLYYMYIQNSVFSNAVSSLEADARSMIHIHFVQTMAGLQSIRCYDVGNEFVTIMESYGDRYTNAGININASIQWLLIRSCWVGSLITVAIGVIDMLLTGDHAISGGYLAMALSYAIQLNGYMRGTFRLIAIVESQLSSVHLIDELIALPKLHVDESDNGGRRKPAERGGSMLTTQEQAFLYNNDEVNCNIEFDNVTMKYQYGPIALRSLSFVIQKGERIGVVGRTG